MRRKRLAAAIAILLALGVIVWIRRSGGFYSPTRYVFDGDSAGLKRMVVVPALDTPMPKGENVVWCSSFGIAWKHMVDDVSKRPLVVPGAEAVAARLNRVAAGQPEREVPLVSCYAAAGRVGDGIVPTIQGEMRKRFPDAPAPQFSVAGDPRALVAYAYLAVNARFPKPYDDSKKPLEFRAAGGTRTPVRAFGLPPEDEDKFRDVREQTAVLYNEERGPGRTENEWAVDLCKDGDVHVMVAVVKPAATLAETLSSLDEKTAAYSGGRTPRPISIEDVLLVPNLAWRIAHHFGELEGKPVTNPAALAAGGTIVEASQGIAFRLDRSGAELRSEAKLLVAGIAAQYVADRPFLVVLKTRGASNPFFAAWIENAELLTPARGK